MKYPQDLMKVAERLVAIADDIPGKYELWTHISNYGKPEWIVPGLHMARVLVKSHGNGQVVQAAIRAYASENGTSFTDEVNFLRDLAEALAEPLGVLNLIDLQAMVGYLECYLGRLIRELVTHTYADDDESDADEIEDWKTEDEAD